MKNCPETAWGNRKKMLANRGCKKSGKAAFFKTLA
jgi:hypothetical protein